MVSVRQQTSQRASLYTSVQLRTVHGAMGSNIQYLLRVRQEGSSESGVSVGYWDGRTQESVKME